MATEEIINNGTLSGRDYERTLSSIRSDATKVKALLEQMEDDRDKLEAGGHPAPALVLNESITVIRVALKHLGDVFRVNF
jgi:hypothetical protein